MIIFLAGERMNLCVYRVRYVCKLLSRLRFIVYGLRKKCVLENVRCQRTIKIGMRINWHRLFLGRIVRRDSFFFYRCIVDIYLLSFLNIFFIYHANNPISVEHKESREEEMQRSFHAHDSLCNWTNQCCFVVPSHVCIKFKCSLTCVNSDEMEDIRLVWKICVSDLQQKYHPASSNKTTQSHF